MAISTHKSITIDVKGNIQSALKITISWNSAFQRCCIFICGIYQVALKLFNSKLQEKIWYQFMHYLGFLSNVTSDTLI